jgi:hypothetical protein
VLDEVKRLLAEVCLGLHIFGHVVACRCHREGLAWGRCEHHRHVIVVCREIVARQVEHIGEHDWIDIVVVVPVVHRDDIPLARLDEGGAEAIGAAEQVNAEVVCHVCTDECHPYKCSVHPIVIALHEEVTG